MYTALVTVSGIFVLSLLLGSRCGPTVQADTFVSIVVALVNFGGGQVPLQQSFATLATSIRTNTILPTPCPSLYDESALPRTVLDTSAADGASASDIVVPAYSYHDAPEEERPRCATDLTSSTSSSLAKGFQMSKGFVVRLVSLVYHTLTLSPWINHHQLGQTPFQADADVERHARQLVRSAQLACKSAERCRPGESTRHTSLQKQGVRDNGEAALFWTSGDARPESWSEIEHSKREIPQYVFDHAPLVHLYSGEQFWPCDIAEHLIHTTPYLNFDALAPKDARQNLTDLDKWNKYLWQVYLTSDDDVEDRPEWLAGENNIPQEPDDGGNEDDDNDKIEASSSWTAQLRRTGRATIDRLLGHTPEIVGGKSEAPVLLFVVPKENGTVDAFWFFFYSFNLGNTVANVRFGNHVGDWEHTLVRFVNGTPTEVFLSEHSFGDAYEYEALDKIGKRPLVYSATGTHAMYATPGVHSYILPWGLLHDVTDNGPLWDPLLNKHAYTYDPDSDHLRASTATPHAPTSWFHYMGHWGDKMYTLNDPRQYVFLGQYHYVDGPTGPRFKGLARKTVCDHEGECKVKKSRGLAWLDAPRVWTGAWPWAGQRRRPRRTLLRPDARNGEQRLPGPA